MNCYLHYNIKKWNIQHLRELANFIASSLNYHLPFNKAIVGDAAFEHESGIHLFGIKMHPLTYEIFPPELVGQERRVVIGKRSGKYGIQMKVEDVIGEKVDDKDPRLLKLIELIKDEFVNGERRFAFTEDEFKELVQGVDFKIKRNTPAPPS
jgi:isopropylmalate/homocitrate/citramalate synthase